MECFRLENVTFSYPSQGIKAIDGVTMTIEQGEFLVLCGPSGGGKSTLLRQLKPALTPHGTQSGAIFFEHRPLDTVEPRCQSQFIGFVQQAPENQIVTDKVWHELAFGLENLGVDTPTIRRRVAEMASFFGIQTWFHRMVSELSGGQKQLLNLASVMVLQPKVLILDEPTSQLDPIAASEFLAVLGRINREFGTTIILSEHRLEEALPLATQVVVMERGKLLCMGTPYAVGERLRKMNHGMVQALPTPMQIWMSVENSFSCPVTVREGREWLASFHTVCPVRALSQEIVSSCSHEVAIHAHELWFQYGKEQPETVRGLSLRVHRGEFLALLGGNGAGKTTTLKLLSGGLLPCRGTVRRNGTVGVLPQNPQALFLKKTVREDLLEGSYGGNHSTSEQEAQVNHIVALCRLEELLERHPYDLSGGEQQRAALAKVLLTQPDLLFLDEPTKGLDAEFKKILGAILQELLSQGVTIVIVSHDIEFCAAYAHRCALVFDGDLVAQGTPRYFFSGNSFYTTAANRMARDLLPQAVTAEDVIAACGGVVPQAEIQAPATGLSHRVEKAEEPKSKSVGKHQRQRTERTIARSKRTCLTAILIFLLIPATLLVCEIYSGGKTYPILSFLVLLESMIPFFLRFECGKPSARELVLLAVLCAIGVAGRAVFFMLPEFKPVLALTILVGVAFGSESGFLVGALTMLVSNMLFAQGPWTPWQMFAMGLTGFLAGIFFRTGGLTYSRLSLSLFGVLCAILVYGGIMNTSSALMATGRLNRAILTVYLLSGFPMDCVHGAATGFFLWVGAQPMLEKMTRVKEKYGIVGR